MKIRPCPLCGTSAGIYRSASSISVHCPSCGLHITKWKGGESIEKTEIKLIAFWNSRQADKDIKQLTRLLNKQKEE